MPNFPCLNLSYTGADDRIEDHACTSSSTMTMQIVNRALNLMFVCRSKHASDCFCIKRLSKSNVASLSFSQLCSARINNSDQGSDRSCSDLFRTDVYSTLCTVMCIIICDVTISSMSNAIIISCLRLYAVCGDLFEHKPHFRS